MTFKSGLLKFFAGNYFFLLCFHFFQISSIEAKIIEPNPSPGTGCGIDSVITTNLVCNNQCDGVISVFAHGNGPLFYQWPSLPGMSSATVTGLCSGMFTVIITDSTGCVSTDSFPVSQPPPILFDYSVINTTCPGGCSGEITVAPLDTVTYTYYWPGYVANGPVLNLLCEGSYTVVLTDPEGCSVTGETNVFYDPPFQVNTVSTPASCFSSCDGTATVTANGIGPLSYQWQTGPVQSTQTAVNLCSGTYIVNTTDSIGCVVSDTVYVGMVAPPLINNNITSPVCFGGCDGSAEVTVTAPGNYIYEWNTSPVQDSSYVSGLCAGLYLVQVTDVSTWCTFTDTVDVLNPPAPQITFFTTPSLCENICSGTATVYSDGASPFSYLWQSGCINQTDTALCPGVYSVVITDSAGCLTNASVAVELEELLFNSTAATCNTICDGSADVILPPGQWQISWNTVPVQNTQAITELCGNYYTVLIVDTSGCFITDSVEVVQNQPVIASTMSESVSCNGICDGTALVSAQGNEPFSYYWNTVPVQFTDTVFQLCEGVYMVTVTDSSGCSVVETATVEAPDSVTFTFNTINASCSNLCDGSAVVSASVPGSYLYKWLTVPVQYGASAAGLCSDYTLVEVTSLTTGCMYLDSVLLINPDPVFVAINSIGPTCPGDCNAFASSLALGGHPGYNYLWSNGLTTPIAMNLCSGIYTVTVTDASGCTGQNSVVLPEPDSIHISFAVTQSSCAVCNDGSVIATATGGAPGYLYFWTPGGFSTNTVSNLLPGLYNLCVADANLCLQCSSVTISFVNSVSAVSASDLNITVAPNPFTDNTHILISGLSDLKNENVSLKMFDIGWRELNTFGYSVSESAPDEIDISFHNNGTVPGLYFYEIISSGHVVHSGKLILTTR